MNRRTDEELLMVGRAGILKEENTIKPKLTT